MFRKVLYRVAAGSAVAALAAFGAAGAASASVRPAVNAPSIVNNHFYTSYLAGYGGNGNGNKHYDDVRATVSAPSQSETNVPVPGNELAVGIATQDSENSGNTFTTGLGWVWTGNADDFCGPNTWQLYYGTGWEKSYTPLEIGDGDLQPAMVTDPIHTGLVPVCSSAPTNSYLEIQYNKATGELHFFEGSAWWNKTLINQQDVGYHAFNVPGVGVDSAVGGEIPASVAADLQIGSVASFTSARVTLRGTLKSNNQSLGQQNLYDFEGTSLGGAPSVADPLTLTTSGISVTGPGSSSFSVVAP